MLQLNDTCQGEGEVASIRSAFLVQRSQGKVRHRDVADSLGLSEGELIAAHVGQPLGEGEQHGLTATRLRPEWVEIVAALESLGEVMALTRNASCVHEKVGVYRKTSVNEQIGLVLGGEIDLRIFYRHWAQGLAVMETSDKGVQLSLQFFDHSGTAVHKVFLKPQSHAAAYHELVGRFADDAQIAGWGEAIQRAQAEPPGTLAPPPEVDADAFRSAWRALRDTHDFFGLLKRFGLSRIQAFQLADADQAVPVALTSAMTLLESAADEQIPIMVFVGSKGVIQIHTGRVGRVAPMGPWVNVLDPGFNLHLRQDHVAHAWVVKKPTDDGVVTSLELFDHSGELIAMFFGARKPGQPEQLQWRALVQGLDVEVAHG